MATIRCRPGGWSIDGDPRGYGIVRDVRSGKWLAGKKAYLSGLIRRDYITIWVAWITKQTPVKIRQDGTDRFDVALTDKGKWMWWYPGARLDWIPSSLPRILKLLNDPVFREKHGLKG